MPTCGTHFRQMLDDYSITAPEQLRLVALGMVYGQAEKVWLGACQAAMFRPGETYRTMVATIVERIAFQFGLEARMLPYETSDGHQIREYWVLAKHGDTLSWFDRLHDLTYIEPRWHIIRGQLCGVPYPNIDYGYHERIDHHAPCEPEEP